MNDKKKKSIKLEKKEQEKKIVYGTTDKSRRCPSIKENKCLMFFAYNQRGLHSRCMVWNIAIIIGYDMIV